MNKEIAQTIRGLETLLQDKTAQMFITVETGHDECDIIGTRDAYIRLAKVLLEFVAAVDDDQIRPNATGFPCSSAIGRVFSGEAEVDIDSMTMSQTETQARDRMETLRDL